MQNNIEKLVDMLGYMRPEGSTEQKDFCDTFLKPVMGKPDKHGNYILLIGKRPNIAFMAHHDTVHDKGGYHKPHIVGDFATTRTDCLGADCTTGVWLILAMIEAGSEGVYIVHAGEEIGCVGSRAIIDDSPPWLYDLQACISFDRRGYDSIVTHQMGFRTCSDTFAESLDDAIGLAMKSDPTGSFTDSNEYAFSVSECTNISVGYFNQHGPKENQDLSFALELRDKLIAANWTSLVFARDSAIAWDDYQHTIKNKGSNKYWSNYGDDIDETEESEMSDLIEMNPQAVAEILIQYGFSLLDLREELGISNFH